MHILCVVLFSESLLYSLQSLAVVSHSLFCYRCAATLQAETQKRFESLRVEVEKRDNDIRQLQRSLKESEGLLVSWRKMQWVIF